MTTHIKSQALNVATGDVSVVHYTQEEWDALVAARTAAELPDAKAAKIVEIKAAAGDKIVAKLPEWKQRNMLATGLKLRDIKETRAWTVEEQAVKTKLDEAWAWVTTVRDASDALEAQVDAATTVAEVNAIRS